MNCVILVGRMVFEPEVKTTKSGTTYLPMRIAVDRKDKDRNTDFISCKAWGKTADFIGKYFHKGDGIEVQGRLQSESYEKSDGTKVNELVVMIFEAGFVPKPKSEKSSEPGTDAAADVPVELPFEI